MEKDLVQKEEVETPKDSVTLEQLSEQIAVIKESAAIPL